MTRPVSTWYIRAFLQAGVDEGDHAAIELVKLAREIALPEDVEEPQPEPAKRKLRLVGNGYGWGARRME